MDDDDDVEETEPSEAEIEAIERSKRKALRATARRLEAAGIKFEMGEHRETLTAHIPNGRETREVEWTETSVAEAGDLPIESTRFVGDYMAVWNADSGELEARVRQQTPVEYVMLRRLRGLELRQEDGTWAPFDGTDLPTLTGARRIPWRLIVVDPGSATEVEFSRMSPLGGLFLRPSGLSIKIRGLDISTHDQALEVLEDLGHAFLFDLDYLYGVPIELQRRAALGPRFKGWGHEAAPTFPKNQYTVEAVSLYSYGRSTRGLPLLEYLAYYQVLEHFFPMFSREEGIRELKTYLRNPRFDPENEVALGQLLSVVGRHSRVGAPERDQLRVAVRGSVGEDELREFLETSPIVKDYFTGAKQGVKGVHKLQLSGGSDLRDQIADRIYAIRCRIVHTKQEGGGSRTEPLMPGSREAISIGPDVDLVRLLAQGAIVAAGRRRRGAYGLDGHPTPLRSEE